MNMRTMNLTVIAGWAAAGAVWLATGSVSWAAVTLISVGVIAFVGGVLTMMVATGRRAEAGCRDHGHRNGTSGS
jgi:hypothetical protein